MCAVTKMGRRGNKINAEGIENKMPPKCTL
jgi:hypothetical protein